MTIRIYPHPTCCGIIIFGSFRFDNDNDELEAVKFLTRKTKHGGILYELSLNGSQYGKNQMLVKYLNDKENGWKLTGQFINTFTDNTVYVYNKLISKLSSKE